MKSVRQVSCKPPRVGVYPVEFCGWQGQMLDAAFHVLDGFQALVDVGYAGQDKASGKNDFRAGGSRVSTLC
jgi:hypothetical protein